SGATLVSVENMDESDFLIHTIQPLGNKVGGFWIGLYRNVDGNWLWLDNAALDFVNWEEKESGVEHHCVEMSAPSGYWDNTDCSSKKGFICKKPKVQPFLFTLYLFTDSKKEKARGHMNMWILLTLVLIILLGMGFMIYFLFKIKTQNETEREARQHSMLLEYSHVLTAKDNENDSTNDKEEKEHSVV
ncbi:MRC1 protein, partial [Anhinga anhinga]|nr:MRC1 protein [Anhinga anhinga]